MAFLLGNGVRYITCCSGIECHNQCMERFSCMGNSWGEVKSQRVKHALQQIVYMLEGYQVLC